MTMTLCLSVNQKSKPPCNVNQLQHIVCPSSAAAQPRWLYSLMAATAIHSSATRTIQLHVHACLAKGNIDHQAPKDRRHTWKTHCFPNKFTNVMVTRWIWEFQTLGVSHELECLCGQYKAVGSKTVQGTGCCETFVDPTLCEALALVRLRIVQERVVHVVDDFCQGLLPMGHFLNEDRIHKVFDSVSQPNSFRSEGRTRCPWPELWRHFRFVTKNQTVLLPLLEARAFTLHVSLGCRLGSKTMQCKSQEQIHRAGDW